ncbi:hybrid sensor histidine kinase/response regulator transcription factor [Adhaeribacter rhizoryzae]|uniref:histidine kinase n=1 Tax=Adhaeribacter rhizoryzae TaxID=2607907 RepID=A0A5M6D3W2_9BACT|nr:substrate-binding domain-containing protein [Adhaeribacter rhizoryzae]KAA5541280.1 substrate-binding domain-containing protein [Adhaeribacter rhizoryzae]
MPFREKLLFVIIGFLFLCGCKEKEEPTYTIGFSQCTGNDVWRQDMLRGMQRELAFHPNTRLLYLDAEGNSQTQINQIKELIRAKPDLLIVSPNEAEPITPIVEEVYQKGIPVVVVDRKTASSFYTAYVGGNNYEVGKTAGQYIGAALQGRGQVLEITGLPKSSPTVERHRGFSEAISKYPGITIIKTFPGDWEKNIAKARLQKNIADLPTVDLVFAHNDQMALGAHEVFKEKGLLGKTKFIGIDGLAGPLGGIQMVNDGILNATMLYPTGGEEAIRTAMQILLKKPFNKENILSTAVIDSSNARMIKMQTDKILTQQEDIERQQKRNDEQIALYRNQQILLYSLSGLLVCSVVLGAWALYSSVERKKINKKLKAKNREIVEQRNKIQEMADEAQAATESKFRFFTNISHEFRTPLTLILGPIEGLLHGKADHLMVKQNLKLIQKNAQRLLWLVNQLLDFRKLEGGKIKVKATENDLILFIREIMRPFEQLAKKHHIEFKLTTNLSTVPVWFDTNMMDKVFFNLLSNAFKFTNDYGRIQILVEKDVSLNVVNIKVKDSGIGMSDSEAGKAFEMFYQGQHAAHKGTGLGLPLSKEFISLHHGEIKLVSQPNQGTTFTVQLQLGQQHFTEEEKTTGQVITGEQLVGNHLLEDASAVWEMPAHTEPKKHHVLVIEDHPDLRNFLKFTLQTSYQVAAAAEGQQGLAEAYENSPDLIICDLTLPDTDGLKIVASLKADLRTSHIPVIILTARTGLEQQVEGMQVGADLYLTKPFSPQVLKESVRSLLANRQLVKERFSAGEILHLPPTEGVTISKLDKKFLEDFKRIIDAKLADPDLSVEYLGREIGLSRVQLYRKVKALIGCNVNDYIQTVRLNKSCTLLRQPQASIADVAFQVGFSSATYFSTAFKSKFGVSPTDYKNQHLRTEPV